MMLYDKHKAAFDKLATDGFPHLCEAAKWFETHGDFDRAIGFNSACHHWISGRPASRTSDQRAKAWLDSQRKPIAPLTVGVAPAAQPTGVVMMVVASAANAARAKKMLQILGCEVEEI